MTLQHFAALCLEQYARDNGYLSSDHSVPCTQLGIQETTRVYTEDQCQAQVFGTWIDTASFPLYTYSLSVAVQALTVITMGTLADSPYQRKRILILSSILGSLATISFLFLPSESLLWFCASILALIGNVGFGVSVVCLNSFLPSLTRQLPDVLATPPGPERARLTAKTMAKLSARGIAFGYFSGILGLLLSLIPVTLLKNSTFSLRLAIAASGFWWLGFTVPATFWLKGGSITTNAQDTSKLSIWAHMGNGWIGLWHMLKEAPHLGQAFRFLFAWFLLSDGKLY